MDDLRKAAVLLLSLDKPVAAEVLAQLPRHLVEAVTLEVAKLDDITQDQQQGVLDEFSVLAKARGHIERGGIEFAEQLLAQSLGDENSGEILDAIKQSINAVPFAFLHKAGVDQLLTFLVDEHPQTIALIMSHLPPSMAAEVLSGLPPHKQIDVVRRVASMEGTSPEVVADIEESLRSRMTSLFDRQSEKAGGVPLVAEILNISDRMTNKGILESLEDDSPELVEEIKRLMFVFDDLVKLDDKGIQALLKEVDNSQWAMALKGANQDIVDKVLGNLSQRAADMLREEMDYLGAVKVSEVEGMQSQIVDAVRRLEDAGEIEVAGGGDDEQYIA